MPAPSAWPVLWQPPPLRCPDRFRLLLAMAIRSRLIRHARKLPLLDRLIPEAPHPQRPGPGDFHNYLPSKRVLPPAPDGHRIDVIIPAYRGLKETRACLESVLQNRDQCTGTILVIDDASPEPEVSALLDDYAEKGAIELLRNPQNLGFVRTANRGILATESRGRDIILLNSDTVVPEGWTERLAAHAHADASIGTITPLSNDATICSWPTRLGGGLPDGFEHSAFDRACLTANRSRQVPIFTGVGFSLYIRRACLTQTGLLDAEKFEMGYGEEVDFCLRASQKGWRNIAACDLFVFHAGSVSFGKQSKAMQESWHKLCALYPSYAQWVKEHLSNDPLTPCRWAASAALLKQTEQGAWLRLQGSAMEDAEGEGRTVLTLNLMDRDLALSLPPQWNEKPLLFARSRDRLLLKLLRSFGIPPERVISPGQPLPPRLHRIHQALLSPDHP